MKTLSNMNGIYAIVLPWGDEGDGEIVVPVSSGAMMEKEIQAYFSLTATVTTKEPSIYTTPVGRILDDNKSKE